MIAAFALAAAVAPATPPPPCRTATAALRRAESDWTAFRNGDFVDDPAGAEAHRRAAAKELAQADAAAKHCPHDATGAERAGLHYEMQLVAARRRARAEGLPEPVVPPPPPAPAQGNGACAQPDLPPHPLGAISPVVLDQSRLHRPHGTTAITVLVGPGGNVSGRSSQRRRGIRFSTKPSRMRLAWSRTLPRAPAARRCRASTASHTRSHSSKLGA